MAHGKETPRQKMIGMMYLILTALLALNVSKEAVEAFKRVDEGLNKTTYNFMQQNSSVYSNFEEKAIANPQKAGQWMKVAKSVQERSNELFDYMQALKIEIVKNRFDSFRDIGNFVKNFSDKIDFYRTSRSILINKDLFISFLKYCESFK